MSPISRDEIQPPRGSRVDVERTPSGLRIHVPAVGLTSGHVVSFFVAILATAFAALLLANSAYGGRWITHIGVVPLAESPQFGWIVALFFAAIAAAIIARTVRDVGDATESARIERSGSACVIERRRLGITTRTEFSAPFDVRLRLIRVRRNRHRDQRIGGVRILEIHGQGRFVALLPGYPGADQDWIAAQLKAQG